MKVSDFAILVSKKEGKKKQVNIAQIKEILKVSDAITKGLLYKLIRSLPFIAIIISLTLSACIITITHIPKKIKEKTFGEATDKKLLKEMFNHWSFKDVTGGGKVTFLVVVDTSCKCPVTRRLLFNTK